MPERKPAGSSTLYNAPSTLPQSQMLERAKAYNHITAPGMPPSWAFNSSGNLVLRNQPQTGVAIGPPIHDPFWKQLLHAAPYIGMAFAMGIPVTGGAAASGGGGAAAAGGGLSAGATGVAANLPGAMATLPALGAGGTLAGVGATLPAVSGSLTGVEAGATAGVGAGLPGGMAALPALGAGGTLASVGAGGGAAGNGAWDAAGNFIGDSTVNDENGGGENAFMDWLKGHINTSSGGNGSGGLSDGLLAALLGGGTLANLIGGLNAQNAAKDAAQIQADAARHAADLQAQSTREALDFLKSQDSQNRTTQAPWVRVGQGAIGKLGFLTGINESNYQPGDGATASSADGNALTFPGRDPNLPPVDRTTVGPPREAPIGPGGEDGYLYQPPGLPRVPAPTSTPTPGPIQKKDEPRSLASIGQAATPMPDANASAYVKMRAPNGFIKDVPADQVQHYTQLGATLVVDQQEVA